MQRWIPWRFLARHTARSQGFIDPIALYARLQQFSQPAEVAEPVELLRAGVVFHARGLVNSKVIQHNLDWVWPFWIERQFDPHDPAFIPRAFSITHINLTHRNWTALGLPGIDALPIVDPHGLLTPHHDGWSIDTWLIGDDSVQLLPSRMQNCQQTQHHGDSLSVRTHCTQLGKSLTTVAEVVEEQGQPVCHLCAEASLHGAGWLIFAARPCNPEGISFIDQLVLSDDQRSWSINSGQRVAFDAPVERHQIGTYAKSDVHVHLLDQVPRTHTECPVGMASAAALYRVPADDTRSVSLRIPLKATPPRRTAYQLPAHRGTAHRPGAEPWTQALSEQSILSIPDAHQSHLYEAAVHTLVLCSPGDVFAGPYTYKRYWYRDAVFVCHGLLCAGLTTRALHIAQHFPDRQAHDGYYHSQEGEWDSNGQVLWLLERLFRITRGQPDRPLWTSIHLAARWIQAKRLPATAPAPLGGLLPAGFSAEHLGPNDYYFWDDFWAIAGLQGAARLCARAGDQERAGVYANQAVDFQAAVTRSIEHAQNRLHQCVIPAAPARRMDAGAIGSIVAGYPLQLGAPDDPALLGTIEYLLTQCFHKNGFFQDMIHSGTNAYLTLQVAQVLMRAGDSRFTALVDNIAQLASPTGHWPEAIHPHTGGGCMGDGHHAWAAAEWVAMMRNSFVREEADHLVVGGGIQHAWLRHEQTVAFGPAPTAFGLVTVRITPRDDRGRWCQVSLDAHWHDVEPRVDIRLPGFFPASLTPDGKPVVVQRLDL